MRTKMQQAVALLSLLALCSCAGASGRPVALRSGARIRSQTDGFTALLGGRLVLRAPPQMEALQRPVGIMDADIADDAESRLIWPKGDQKFVIFAQELLTTSQRQRRGQPPRSPRRAGRHDRVHLGGLQTSPPPRQELNGDLALRQLA
jgi:hypothetical protein